MTRRTSPDPFAEVMEALTQDIRERLGAIPPGTASRLEEIRIRVDRPVQLVMRGGDAFLGEGGGPVDGLLEAYRPDRAVMGRLVARIAQWSVYALEEELRQGFITLRGGHRVGLAGRGTVEDGHLRGLRDIAGLNIRITREVKGAADPLLPRIAGSGRWLSALIVSPPQCGKTTLLRDLCRSISTGVPRLGMRGLKVGVVDERSEIAGCVAGVPQREVGPRTDVLDAVPKAEGMVMMTRALSPDVMITDEIGRAADAHAMLDAVRSGVSVLASAHGASREDVASRPSTRLLFDEGVFERIVCLSRRRGPGTVEAVLDGQGRPIKGEGV